MMTLIYEGELYHHGIKGQRWGVRRFQPYPKGHKVGKEVGDAAKAEKKKKFSYEKAFEKTVKQGKDKPDISPAEKIAKDANNATQEIISGTKRIMEKIHNSKPKMNNAAGLSDQELRTRINRIKMEREYNSLTSDEISKGYEAAMTALNTIGSIVGIAGATAGIVATVHSMKK